AGPYRQTRGGGGGRSTAGRRGAGQGSRSISSAHADSCGSIGGHRGRGVHSSAQGPAVTCTEAPPSTEAPPLSAPKEVRWEQPEEVMTTSSEPSTIDRSARSSCSSR